jgi:hypothetical protein
MRNKFTATIFFVGVVLATPPFAFGWHYKHYSYQVPVASSVVPMGSPQVFPGFSGNFLHLPSFPLQPGTLTSPGQGLASTPVPNDVAATLNRVQKGLSESSDKAEALLGKPKTEQRPGPEDLPPPSKTKKE